MDIMATGIFGPNVPAAGMPPATATGGFFALALSGAGMVAAGAPAGAMPAGAGRAATQLGVSTLFEISPAPGLPASPLAAATLGAAIAGAPDQAPIPAILVPAAGEPATAQLPDEAAAGLAVTAKLTSSASVSAGPVKAPAAAKTGVSLVAAPAVDQPAPGLAAPTAEDAAAGGEAAAPSAEPKAPKEGDVSAEAKTASDPVAATPLPVAAPIATAPPSRAAALGFGVGDRPVAQQAAAAPHAPAATAGETSVLAGATARMAARAGNPLPDRDGEASAATDFEATMTKMGGETASIASRPGDEMPAPADRSERTASAEKVAPSASQSIETAQRPAIQIGPDRAGASANPAPAPAVGPAPAAQATTPTTAAAAPAHPVPVEAQHPVLSARSGRMGRDMGVEIARRIASGGEELVIRLDPAELGRIHIRMALNEQGHLRAVVAADAPAALEALRQEIGDLGRALDQAGVKTDSDSIRFDRGGSGGDNGSAWQRYQGQERSGRQATGLSAPADDVPQQPTVRANRRVDLMA